MELRKYIPRHQSRKLYTLDPGDIFVYKDIHYMLVNSVLRDHIASVFNLEEKSLTNLPGSTDVLKKKAYLYIYK